MEGPGWNWREVWDYLRAIIVEELGVPADRVVESAEFVSDLGRTGGGRGTMIPLYSEG